MRHMEGDFHDSNSSFREEGNAVVVTFRVEIAPIRQFVPHVAAQVAPHVTPQVEAVLQAARSDAKTRAELQKAARIRDREHFRKAYLEPLLASGWLERTIPNKPRSRNQRYRTTDAGLAITKDRGRKKVE